MKLAFVRLCLSKAELLGPPARLQKGRWQRGAGGEGARKYRQVREKRKKKTPPKVIAHYFLIIIKLER